MALWAVQRWGLNGVALRVARGNATAEEARERAAPLLALFAPAQIDVRVQVEEGEPQIVLEPFGPTPAQRRAAAAARMDAAPALPASSGPQ